MSPSPTAVTMRPDVTYLGWADPDKRYPLAAKLRDTELIRQFFTDPHLDEVERGEGRMIDGHYTVPLKLWEQQN